MEFNFKDIFIGNLIEKRVEELQISTERICNFLKLNEKQLTELYKQNDINTDLLLRCSKLLEYDFFRIYSQHLLLYAPPASVKYKEGGKRKTESPQFRKSLYTTEIIHFIMELVEKGEMKNSEIITRYNIPKTTLYKWIKKHKK